MRYDYLSIVLSLLAIALSIGAVVLSVKARKRQDQALAGERRRRGEM
jgi:heme exporter protein D